MSYSEGSVSQPAEGDGNLGYIRELMKKAIRLHRSGRRQEATKLYAEIKELSKAREERLTEEEEKQKLEARKRKDAEAAEDKMDVKISLDYKNADLLTVLRSLSWTYNLNIITSPDIKGKITISLKEVTVKEALEAIITISGLTYTMRNNIIYISPGDAETAEFISEIIFLKYTKAADAQNLLRKTISGKGDIKTDEIANSLIITDYPANIQKFKSLLGKVDVPPRQVLIEAKIVDITSTDLEALGVTWNLKYAPAHGIFDGDTHLSEEIDTTIDMSEQSSNLTGSQIRIDDLNIRGLTIDATLDALVKDGKADVLASPSIAVLNGQEARIIIGERYPYKERTQTTTGTTETTKFVDIGTTLRVTPQINEDGYITMNVHPEVSSLHTALDAGPRITTREADTTVRVKEGETLVIGGLIKQTEGASEEKIPLLGDIPLLGFLFKRREHDIERKELAVFITPKILYSREEREYLSKRDIQKEEVYVTLTKTVSKIINAPKGSLHI
jgi:type IV pilus secretin PilQ/predicted competence protein